MIDRSATLLVICRLPQSTPVTAASGERSGKPFGVPGEKIILEVQRILIGHYHVEAYVSHPDGAVKYYDFSSGSNVGIGTRPQILSLTIPTCCTLMGDTITTKIDGEV
jgi:hypothetical protein